MAKKGYAIETYAAGMFIRQEQYAQRVKHLYEQAVNELLALAAQMPIDVDGEVFSFSDNPRIANETTKIIRRLYSQVYGEIKHGVEAEWKYANLSCDRLIESIFGKQIKETNLGARWFQRNKEAMDQFFKRTQADGGMNLSQRVWKYTGDLRGEMENAISVSMGEGVSAATMSRRVRQYLREPNKLFRRVRGSDGKLHLSKPAQLYHPGQGVYRSSYKNAMRLTRTETNAAYRAADEDRWSRMDFVVGFEVKKSNNHPDTDICDDLCGKYPKGFVFTAWHPQCRCFVVPILATPQEMANLQRIAISGGDTSTFVSANHVQTVPTQFTDWVRDNAERIRTAKHIPYWIRDNAGYIASAISDDKEVRHLISQYGAISTKKITNPLRNKAMADISAGLAEAIAAGITALINYYYKAESNAERVAVLRQIISYKGFKRMRYHSTKDHSIFGIGYESFDKRLGVGEMPPNLSIAKKMLSNGYDVYLMPNPNTSTSADFILSKNGKLYYAEGKTLNGANSLDNRLKSKQARRIIIDVIGTNDSRYIASELRIAFEQNTYLDEIILLKRSREIKVNRRMVLSKKYEEVFKKIWENK